MKALALMPKAATIRNRLADAPMTIDPPRSDTYDADRNAQLFKELENLQKRAQIETYAVMWGEMPVATIVIKSTEKQCTAIVTKFVNHQRVMWKSSVRGQGFDRRTEALFGLTIPTSFSHYEGCNSLPFLMRNEGKRWDDQLRAHGFRVWRTL